MNAPCRGSWPRLNEISLVQRNRSESVAGTRSFTQREGQGGIESPARATQTTSRDESVVPVPTLSLDIPLGIACPCVVLDAFSDRIPERRRSIGVILPMIFASYAPIVSSSIRIRREVLRARQRNEARSGIPRI